MSRILNDIEEGRGVSDEEAEIIVRWLWKVDGLLWHLSNPTDAYSPTYNLRDRVLKPLDRIRGELILGVALCAMVEPCYGDAPMGLDSGGGDGIFVSSVFSRTGMMVVLAPFADLMPTGFSKYRLSGTRGQPTSDAKFFYPRTTFRTDTELVGITRQSSSPLAAAHWACAREVGRLLRSTLPG